MRGSHKRGSPAPSKDTANREASAVSGRSRNRDSPGFSVEHDGGMITGPDEESVREFVATVKREKARRARWPLDGREAMAVLAAAFPSMREVPGTDPWDVDLLIEWSTSGAATSGSIWAARFLLSVWNPSTDWNELGLPGPGKFDLHEAWSCWDDGHRTAAMKWLEAPFWP